MTLDEVLEGLDLEKQPEETQLYLVIDKDLRTISVPEKLKTAGVEHDKNTNTLHFKCPRYYQEHDLSTFIIYVNYLNAAGVKDKFYTKKLIVEDDFIYFDWELSDIAAQAKGKLTFIACFHITDPEDNYEILYGYHTTLASVNILEGLEVDSAIISKYPDALMSWAGEAMAEITEAKEASLAEMESVHDGLEETITRLRDDAIEAVTDIHDTSIADMTDTKDAGLEAISDKITQAVSVVTASGELVKADIRAEGNRVIATIPNDYTALSNKVNELNSAIANMDEEVKEVDKRQTEANSQLSDTMLSIIWTLNDNKEAILSNYWNNKRNGKVYQTKLWKYSHNTSSEGVKMLDNTDMVCKPSTDSTEAQDDYENIGLFQWLNCDYVRDEHGFATPTEVEGWGENFVFTGNIDVGVMGMSFYYNIDTSHPEYALWTISDSPQDGLIPYPACVRDDGSFSPYIIHSKYISSVADDGLHRSIKDARPESFMSHDKIIVEYKKKGDGYFGAGIEKSLYGIIYQVIKYGTKNSQSVMQGCVNYNFQYAASVVRETKEKFFPVTKAQANDFIVGASVIVGYGSADGESVNLDRSIGTMRSYAYGSRVTKIEPIDNDNTAIYLDVEEGFDTKPVKLNDTLTANITISSWHWYSGTTDTVIAHHDGSMTSNTNAKYPYRMQGIEYAIGAYTIASDTVMEFQSDYSKKVWVAPKGVARSSNLATIKSTYTDIGTIPNVDTGADFWVADIQTNTDLMAWLPLPNAQSQAVGHGDRCYAGGTVTSGLREYAIGGHLGHGLLAGSVCVFCWDGLTSALWLFAAAD